jgi:dienelactone hydrolase
MYDMQVHYNSLYQSIPQSFAFRGHSCQDLTHWQAELRERLKEALGLRRIERDMAGFLPRAEQVRVEGMDGYTREQWLIWTEPDVPLPFYLLRPQSSSEKLPLVLTPHGHNHPYVYVGIYTSEEEQRSIQEGDRDIAVQAVREGYLVIAPTARGFGETRSAEDLHAGKLSSCRTQLLNGLLVGRTPIGERAWDISRLIDWALASQPADPQRIAITGNSGGGTTTLFTAACDERVALAAPGSYFCTFAGSIGSIFHCECNYVPGLLELGEMYDIAGLIAPRPFFAISGIEDPIFPISETRLAFEKLREIYTAAGAPERCRLYEGQGGHRYYKKGVWPFIQEHFKFNDKVE